MILSKPTENKLRALHHVLVRARTQAYLGMESKAMGRLLDDAEYLATLIFAPDPGDEGEFRALLSDMEKKHDGLTGLIAAYDEKEAASKAVLGRAA